MIATIYNKNREYNSLIFAVFKRNGETAAIVFDDGAERFELVCAHDKYGLKQKIFVTDYNVEGYITKDSVEFDSFTATECLGYEWLLEDSRLLKDIEQGKEADKKYVDLAKKLNGLIDFNVFHEVKTQEDADELLQAAGGFHDSYLTGIEYIASDCDANIVAKICLKFRLYGGHDMVMEFDTDIKIRFDFETHLEYIYTSCIVIDKKLIYWICDEDDCTAEDIDDETMYFAAERLRWRIAPKNR